MSIIAHSIGADKLLWKHVYKINPSTKELAWLCQNRGCDWI